jgi:hypothetical protein
MTDIDKYIAQLNNSTKFDFTKHIASAKKELKVLRRHSDDPTAQSVLRGVEVRLVAMMNKEQGTETAEDKIILGIYEKFHGPITEKGA